MLRNSDASPATTPWGGVVGEGADCESPVVGEGALLRESSACITLESCTTLLSASEKSDSSSTNTTDDVSEGGSDGAVGAGSGALPESQST